MAIVVAGNQFTVSLVNYLRCIASSKVAVGVLGRRTFAAGAKAKKGSKGGAASDAPKASLITKEIKSTTLFGGNIVKDGKDPKLLPDSEYPEWLLHLVDKRSPLSELKRKDAESLSYDGLSNWITERGSKRTTPSRPRIRFCVCSREA